MRADFEKGIKVCCRCRKELPLNMFSKNKGKNDGLDIYCKECRSVIHKRWYKRDIEYARKKNRDSNNKRTSTFQRKGKVRGNSGMLKRNYELTEEQLKRREQARKYNIKRYKSEKRRGLYGILIWYDGELNHLSTKEYVRAMTKEYIRQRNCAIRGYVARVNPFEHFLFDFDLEKMLKDNVYLGGGNNRRCYITKWWKGEIRHWTVNDGIWREQ